MKPLATYALTLATATLLIGSSAFAQTDNTTTNTPVTTRLDQLRMKAQERSDAVKQAIEDKREAAEEKVQEIREAARQRISDIKDAKKQEAANKIVAQLARVNKVATEHFASVLDELDAILQKIQSRAEKARSGGQDVSSVLSAIATAQGSIAKARTAVESQASKVYVIDLSSTATDDPQESLIATLRQQFQDLHTQLKTDLTALRDGPMTDARKAVQVALQALKSVPKVDDRAFDDITR